MYQLGRIWLTLLKLFRIVFRRLTRKLVVICAAIMIGASNVIYEEDRLINLDKIRTEQQEEDKKGK